MPPEPTANTGPERLPIMRYFAYAHLPAHLQTISKLFGVLAEDLHVALPNGAEKVVALRKLLESKDAAVRSALDAPK